jgi:hypothetical protein
MSIASRQFPCVLVSGAGAFVACQGEALPSPEAELAAAFASEGDYSTVFPGRDCAVAATDGTRGYLWGLDHITASDNPGFDLVEIQGGQLRLRDWIGGPNATFAASLTLSGWDPQVIQIHLDHGEVIGCDPAVVADLPAAAWLEVTVLGPHHGDPVHVAGCGGSAFLAEGGSVRVPIANPGECAVYARRASEPWRWGKAVVHAAASGPTAVELALPAVARDDAMSVPGRPHGVLGVGLIVPELEVGPSGRMDHLLQGGDRLIGINGQPVKKLEEVRVALAPLAGHQILVQVVRGGEQLDVALPVYCETDEGSRPPLCGP